MIEFTATIHKFDRGKGEKSGWCYIVITEDLAQKLKPGNRKSFRVKGKLDSFKISGVTLLPMGDGSFIMPINADMRKGTGKKQGAMLQVKIEADKKEYQLNRDLISCLDDEPVALAFFNTLTRGHQNYFSKWIESAKSEPTRIKRIAIVVSSLAKGMDFVAMMRSLKKNTQISEE